MQLKGGVVVVGVVVHPLVHHSYIPIDLLPAFLQRPVLSTLPPTALVCPAARRRGARENQIMVLVFYFLDSLKKCTWLSWQWWGHLVPRPFAKSPRKFFPVVLRSKRHTDLLNEHTSVKHEKLWDQLSQNKKNCLKLNIWFNMIEWGTVIFRSGVINALV